MSYRTQNPNLKLFVSIDMIDSTSMKQRGNWKSIIDYLYSDFVLRIVQTRELANLKIWKYIGDEVVFTYVIKNIEEPSKVISSISKLVQNEQNSKNSLVYQQKIKFKITCWLAGFPVINREKPVYVENAESATSRIIDYFGPSIDTGYRLTKYSTKEKIYISVELAYLLANGPPEGLSKLNYIYFDRYEILKGSMKKKPYPLFWLPMKEDILEIKLLNKRKADYDIVKRCCESFIDDVDDPYLIAKPYIWNEEKQEFIFGEMNAIHKVFYNNVCAEQQYQNAHITEKIITSTSDNLNTMENIRRKLDKYEKKLDK